MDEGWHTDPTGRHGHRYHDGEDWTEHVADQGVAGVDPLTGGTGTTEQWPGAATTSTVTTPMAPSASAPTTRPAGPGPGGPVGPTQQRAGWSTGAKVVAVLVVLLLIGGAGLVGFFIGAASDVGATVLDELEGLEGFDTGGPDSSEVVDSGAVLSSDAPVFDGTVDGPTAMVVRITRESPVSIEVVEGDFDTYLYLYDASGQLVAQDDDGGVAGTRLSRIETTVPPGDYRLVLDAFASATIDAGSPVLIRATFTGG